MPTISLIVPAYNAERTLPRCIESALAQTYADFELLATDDGSTDGTLAVLERYAAADPRVRPIHTENGGVSRARNLALEQAQGEYWLFLDADDALEPTAMAELLARMTGPGVRMTVGTDQRVDENDRLMSRPAIPQAQAYPHDQAALAMLRGAPFDGTLHAKLLRKSDTRFDEDVHIYEDMLFLLRYLQAPGETSFFPAPLHRYTVQPGSAMLGRLTAKKCSSLAACQRMQTLARAFCPEAEEAARRFRLMDALMVCQRIAEAPAGERNAAWAREARIEARQTLLADPGCSLHRAGFTASQRALYRCLRLGWPVYRAAYRGVYRTARRLLR